MEKQNYRHYRRYYIPHHFIFLPMISFFMVLGIINSYQHPQHKLEWLLFSLLSFSILYLALMLRQHYALGNQDRIVRLEFRLRYFELMHKSSSHVEGQLSFAQIASLRFADDAEFLILLDRTLKENLNADDIKRSIRNWQADHMRL